MILTDTDMLLIAEWMNLYEWGWAMSLKLSTNECKWKKYTKI